MKLNLKKVILILFVLVVPILLAILYFAVLKPNLTPSKAYDGPIAKLKVASIGEFSIYNYIAEEKGIFTKYGLDVEVIQYPDGPSAVGDLLADKVNFATAADFVGVSNIFANENLRIVAQQNRHETFKIIARKDKGITKESDLKGKKIGVTRKGVGEFFLGSFLTFNHIAFQEVEIVDLKPADILSQLQAGQIDAAIIFNPHAYTLEKEMGQNVIVWPAQGGQKIFAMLYSTKNYLGQNPEVTERYVQAILEAEAFLKQNEQEAKQILGKAMNYSGDYVGHIWKNFDYTIGLDQALLLSMEDQARFVLKNNLTSETEIPNYLDYIYFDPLEKAKPQRITIIR